MKTSLIIILTLITLAGTTSLLADPVEDPEISKTVVHVKNTPSWLSEVNTILAAKNDTRAALEKEFTQAANENQALAIQRQIQELEETTELQIMNVQLVHLKQSGRTEEAESLAAAIKEMTDPKPNRAPEPREESAGR